MSFRTTLFCAAIGFGVLAADVFAQTDGKATLRVTLLDYNGSGAKHWTVVWVTTESGSFIKTLRKQGPSITSSHWRNHCSTWTDAKGSSVVLDGYSSATATSYSGTNSPVILAWDGRDANSQLMPDGGYKFWVQYAEDNGQGPFTTGGLLWTKGPVGAVKTYPKQGANFDGMEVAWNPVAVPVTVRITSITSAGDRIVLRGIGPANAPCHLLAAAPFSDSPAWIAIATNVFDATGELSFTNAIRSDRIGEYYWLRLP